MIFLKILSGIFLCFILSWGGSFILFFKKPVLSIQDLLKRLILGSLVLAIITAIVATKGHTILILALPPMIFLGWYSRENNILTSSERMKWRDWMALSIFIIVAASIAFLNIRGVDYIGMKVPINDQSWYATISRGMIAYRVESYFCYLQPYFAYETLTNPYHYYEYWITSIIYFFTHYNTHLILNGVVAGFSLTCVFMGFYAIFNLWIRKNILLTIICSLSFIAIRGLIHYFPAINENFVQATDSIFFDGNQKLIYILPFFLLGFYYLFQGKEISGILILLLFPALNIVCLPSIVGGIAIFLCYRFFKSRKSYKNFFHEHQVIIYTMILLMLTLFIYLKFLTINLGNDGMEKSLNAIAGNILTNGGRWLLINSLILILLGWLLIKGYDTYTMDIFILGTGMVISGIIGYALFDNNQNAWQMYSTPARLSGFVFCLLFIYIFRKNHKKVRNSMVILGSMAILMFIENFSQINYLPMKKISAYSPQYVEGISRYQFKNKVGIKFVNVSNRQILQRNPIYSGICNYLVLTENAFSTIVLNVDDLLSIDKKDSTIDLADLGKDIVAREIILGSPFLNASGLGKQTITRQELEACKKRFIERWKPEFCVIENGIDIPDYIKIKERLTDSGTGEQFLILIN